MFDCPSTEESLVKVGAKCGSPRPFVDNFAARTHFLTNLLLLSGHGLLTRRRSDNCVGTVTSFSGQRGPSFLPSLPHGQAEERLDGSCSIVLTGVLLQFFVGKEVPRNSRPRAAISFLSFTVIERACCQSSFFVCFQSPFSHLQLVSVLVFQFILFLAVFFVCSLSHRLSSLCSCSIAAPSCFGLIHARTALKRPGVETACYIPIRKDSLSWPQPTSLALAKGRRRGADS